MTQLTHGRPTFSYERSEVLTTAKVNIYGQILKTNPAGVIYKQAFSSKECKSLSNYAFPY